MRRALVALLATAAPAWAAPEATTRFSGLVQTDYTWAQDSVDQLDDGSGASLNRDGFAVRRGRLRVEAASGPIEAVIEGAFDTVDGAQLGLRQVEAALRWSADEGPL
ncbi:MAG: hypothetical protein KC620_04720, partial [Myxococcales bacterium]|nr:hypothetical protein [Myxococcales bacterium]